MKIMKAAIQISTFALFCFACTTTEPQYTGTISETECAVVGLVQHQNNTPASDATIILHDQRSITQLTLSKKLSAIRSGRTTTDINGFFRIDSVDTGAFYIEINDHDTLGSIVPVNVGPGDTLVSIEGILHKFGTIIGKIDTSKNGALIQIYLPQIGRTLPVDTLGNFVIDKLPEFNYTLRLVIDYSIVKLPSDTILYQVLSGDTTYISSLGAKNGTISINGSIQENP